MGFLSSAFKSIGNSFGNIVGGIGGSAVSGLFGQSSANEQMKFQREMSNTSLQRMVADARAAGINPLFAIGQGGASTPSGASASMPNPSLNILPATAKRLQEVEMRESLQRQSLSRTQEELLGIQIQSAQEQLQRDRLATARDQANYQKQYGSEGFLKDITTTLSGSGGQAEKAGKAFAGALDAQINNIKRFYKMFRSKAVSALERERLQREEADLIRRLREEPPTLGRRYKNNYIDPASLEKRGYIYGYPK